MIRLGFRHRGIVYEFKFAKMHNVLAQIPQPIATRLSRYYDLVIANKVPNELFEEGNSIRCSQFRITGLKKKAQTTISARLIETGVIQYLTANDMLHVNAPNGGVISQIFGAFHELRKDFERAGFTKPDLGHGPVLNKILLTNNCALSVESPIWTYKQTTLADFMAGQDKNFSFSYKFPLTGHIDLLLYNPETTSIIIADYKPEGHFLHSIPQIATYGLIFRRILKIPNIQCVSFREKEAWVYDPEIVKNEIEEEIKKNGDPKLQWRKIVKDL